MSVRNGVVKVSVSGTGVALSGSARPVTSVVIVALDANVGKVAVGGLDTPVLSPQNTLLLAAGESVPFGAINLADVHINGASNDGVGYLTEE